MCKYANTKLGHRVGVNITKAVCQCGNPLSAYIGPALYMGHTTIGVVYDFFQIVGEWVCASCGRLNKRYFERCYTGLVKRDETFHDIELIPMMDGEAKEATE